MPQKMVSVQESQTSDLNLNNYENERKTILLLTDLAFFSMLYRLQSQRGNTIPQQQSEFSDFVD